MNKKILDAIKDVAKEQNVDIDITSKNMDVPLKQIGIDSITAVSMVVGIEQKLGVRVADSDLAKITTLGLLVEYFEKLVK